LPATVGSIIANQIREAGSAARVELLGRARGRLWSLYKGALFFAMIANARGLGLVFSNRWPAEVR
jgi:hypothetical protein